MSLTITAGLIKFVSTLKSYRFSILYLIKIIVTIQSR